MTTEIPHWHKLVPFALRARQVVVGRARLTQLQKKLAFLMISTDISENSKKEALRDYGCPVYQLMTMTEIQELFGFKGTKMLGFLRSSLSNAIAAEWKTFKLKAINDGNDNEEYEKSDF